MVIVIAAHPVTTLLCELSRASAAIVVVSAEQMHGQKELA
jgi:hypothetical protein